MDQTPVFKFLAAWSIGDLDRLFSFWRLGIKAVVTISQFDLRDVESASRTPFSDGGPHLDGSEQAFHTTGRFPLQTLANAWKRR